MAGVRFVAIALALLLVGASAQTPIDGVDDLVAAVASGGEYRIAPGTYVLDAALDVAGTVSIVGSGPDDVIIEASGGPIAVRVGEGARLHLEGLRHQGTAQGADDVFADNGQDVTEAR